MEKSVIIKPVGYVRSDLKERYEAPRQGTMTAATGAVIELEPGCNFEQALTGLEGFSHLWIVYFFHLNTGWKPMVTPPRNKGKKVGVFATRSPHRPDNIGLSCVKYIKHEGLKIYISGSDMLDGTPVLDIKPYLPYSDSFPDALTGWAGDRVQVSYEVNASPEAERQAAEIKQKEGQNLLNYARVQLSVNPDDMSRKRIARVDDGEYYLSYRKWRIYYEVDINSGTVHVSEIR
ncbi:MAG: tRNA (adenine(37)-N6)-methyltransferase [Ignavibacteriaceae bacterium]|nr:tRNA (adenine(37)-N6)-methyltransferase [Ignavibacteriaceae bacterium]